jgi:hypothetical protein
MYLGISVTNKYEKVVRLTMAMSRGTLQFSDSAQRRCVKIMISTALKRQEESPRKRKNKWKKADEDN